MYRQTQATTDSTVNGDLYVLVKQARFNTAVLRDAFITWYVTMATVTMATVIMESLWLWYLWFPPL